MELGTFLIGAGAASVLLFLLTGMAQALTPWGIRAVKEVKREEMGDLPEALARITPPIGMYGVFNSQISAFIAVRQGAYYNLGRYFSLEVLNQFLVGTLLAAILALTNPLGAETQLLLVLLIGLLAEIAIDGQYWNWWGFTARYTVGFAVNRIVALMIAAFVVVTWIF